MKAFCWKLIQVVIVEPWHTTIPPVHEHRSQFASVVAMITKNWHYKGNHCCFVLKTRLNMPSLVPPNMSRCVYVIRLPPPMTWIGSPSSKTMELQSCCPLPQPLDVAQTRLVITRRSWFRWKLIISLQERSALPWNDTDLRWRIRRQQATVNLQSTSGHK